MASAAGTAVTLAAIRALHARLLHDRSLQFDFAAAPPPAPARPPAWLEALAEMLKALGGVLNQIIGPALPVVKGLFWVGVGAAILLVVWLIVREIMGAGWARRRRERKVRPRPADWAPDSRRARALLENADRLAAQGRFDMAVRLILHRGVEDIEVHRPRLVRPALTARDIAGLEALPARARDAFARIAAVVEFSAFAGQPIGRTAFDQCRAAYQAFVTPEAWR